MCSICQQLTLNQSLVSFGCGHVFHHDCVHDLIEIGEAIICPECRSPIQFLHMLQPDFEDVVLALRAAQSFVSAVSRSQGIIDSIIQLLGVDPAQGENQNNNGNDNGNANQDGNQANQNDGVIEVQPDNNDAVPGDNDAENPTQDEHQNNNGNDNDNENPNQNENQANQIANENENQGGNQANQNDGDMQPDINDAVPGVIGAEAQIELRRQRRLRRRLRFLTRLNLLIARQFRGNH